MSKTQLVAPDVEFMATVNGETMTICYDYYEYYDEYTSEWVQGVELTRVYNDDEEFDLDSDTFYATCLTLALENLQEFTENYYEDDYEGDYDE